MKEPDFLTLADVIEIHRNQIKRMVEILEFAILICFNLLWPSLRPPLEENGFMRIFMKWQQL